MNVCVHIILRNPVLVKYLNLKHFTVVRFKSNLIYMLNTNTRFVYVSAQEFCTCCLNQQVDNSVSSSNYMNIRDILVRFYYGCSDLFDMFMHTCVFDRTVFPFHFRILGGVGVRSLIIWTFEIFSRDIARIAVTSLYACIYMKGCKPK